jgi:hypothetical protein
MALDVVGCPGRFAILDWSTVELDAFHHYQALRSSSSTIAPVDPPEPPAVAPDSLFTKDPSASGGIDKNLDAGSVSYRALAVDAEDRTIGKSPVRTVTVSAAQSLGTLDAAVDAGSVTISWTPFDGPEACFTAYKLAASTTDDQPSYLGGVGAVWVGESQGAGVATIEGLEPGTWYLRLEAVRATESGKLLVGRSTVATVTIP